jgi:hypothetical protein
MEIKEIMMFTFICVITIINVLKIIGNLLLLGGDKKEPIMTVGERAAQTFVTMIFVVWGVILVYNNW